MFTVSVSDGCIDKYAQKFTQNASRNFPKISPIMLFSVPIMLALCS